MEKAEGIKKRGDGVAGITIKLAPHIDGNQ